MTETILISDSSSPISPSGLAAVRAESMPADDVIELEDSSSASDMDLSSDHEAGQIISPLDEPKSDDSAGEKADFIAFQSDNESSKSEDDEDQRGTLWRPRGNPSADDRHYNRRRSTSPRGCSSYPTLGKRKRSGEMGRELIEEAIESAKKPPWAGGKSYSSNLTHMLHEEIVDFVQFLEPTEEEHQLRAIVITALENIIHQNFGRDTQLVVFGSYETKLYLPDSDIDVTVRFRQRANERMYTGRIAHCLRRSSEFRVVEHITNARVPIVKAQHRYTGIDIDISANQTTGDQAVAWVREKILAYPALRPLTLLLKQFLLCRDLNEVYSGGISSFTVITMIMCFLESHPLLLAGHINQESNLGILLLEWLELFATAYNHKNTTVTWRGFVPKAVTMQRINKIRPELMSVLDPTNPDNDLACGSRQAREIMTAFQWAFDMLTGAILLHTEHRRPAKTLLGLVLHVDERILTQRRARLNFFRELMVQAVLEPSADQKNQQDPTPKPPPKSASSSASKPQAKGSSDRNSSGSKSNAKQQKQPQPQQSKKSKNGGGSTGSSSANPSAMAKKMPPPPRNVVYIEDDSDGDTLARRSSKRARKAR